MYPPGVLYGDFVAGERTQLREALDTPDEDDDIITLADRWLSTLRYQEERAHKVIQQITVIAKLAAR